MTWWRDKNQKAPTITLHAIDKGCESMDWKISDIIYTFHCLPLACLKFYLIWSCFYLWICWFIMFKLRFKSRDLDSSSQVQGSPCGQELANLVHRHRVLVTVGPGSAWHTDSQSEDSTEQHWPMRGQQLAVSLCLTRANSPAAAGGQPGPALRSPVTRLSLAVSTPGQRRAYTSEKLREDVYMIILIILLFLKQMCIVCQEIYQREIYEISKWDICVTCDVSGRHIPGYTGPRGPAWA